MGTREPRNFRFPKKFNTALKKVSAASGMTQTEMLEAAFWLYHEAVSKMTTDERRKLDAEARAYLEKIMRGNIE